MMNTLLELEKDGKSAKRIGSADPSKKAAKSDSQDVAVIPSADAEVNPLHTVACRVQLAEYSSSILECISKMRGA